MINDISYSIQWNIISEFMSGALSRAPAKFYIASVSNEIGNIKTDPTTLRCTPAFKQMRSFRISQRRCVPDNVENYPFSQKKFSNMNMDPPGRVFSHAVYAVACWAQYTLFSLTFTFSGFTSMYFTFIIPIRCT